MGPEVRHRLKKWSMRAGIVLGAAALVGSVAVMLPSIVERSNALAAAVDKDFEDTRGVDLRWNPNTNVYSAATRPSARRAASHEELMRGIMQRVVRESGCDVLSITYFPDSSNRDQNARRDLYQIPVLCPSRNR